MRRHEGKIVFISGGSKGIGLACAQRLAEEGASLFLVASNVDRLNDAAQDLIGKTQCKLGTHGADLRTIEGCQSAANAVLEKFGACDVFIHSAGATRGGLFPEQPDEDMIDGFALKFHAAVRLSRLLWPALKESRGCVLNIVGGFARTPAADFMVGGAVNAALANFSKALADKGLADDVNVNWIHPGLTVTERLDGIFSDRANQQGKTRDEIERDSIKAEGIRRLGAPEDVAALVAFLCSAEARHVHGTCVAIDGGGAKGYY